MLLLLLAVSPEETETHSVSVSLTSVVNSCLCSLSLCASQWMLQVGHISGHCGSSPRRHTENVRLIGIGINGWVEVGRADFTDVPKKETRVWERVNVVSNLNCNLKQCPNPSLYGERHRGHPLAVFAGVDGMWTQTVFGPLSLCTSAQSVVIQTLYRGAGGIKSV